MERQERSQERVFLVPTSSRDTLQKGDRKDWGPAQIEKSKKYLRKPQRSWSPARRAFKRCRKIRFGEVDKGGKNSAAGRAKPLDEESPRDARRGL